MDAKLTRIYLEVYQQTAYVWAAATLRATPAAMLALKVCSALDLKVASKDLTGLFLELALASLLLMLSKGSPRRVPRLRRQNATVRRGVHLGGGEDLWGEDLYAEDMYRKDFCMEDSRVEDLYGGLYGI